MPHPKGKLKQSGDVHLPDVESDLDLEEGENDLADLGKERRQPRGAAERVRDAGLLVAGDGQEQDAPRGPARDRPARPSGAAAAPRARPQPAAFDRRDPQGLAAAFRAPAAHAASSVAQTARTASPWALWVVGLVAALAVVRALR